MRSDAAALVLAAVLPASAVAAQEPGHHEPDFGIGVGAHGRFGFPFGSADRDIAAIAGGGGAVIAIDEHLSWGELFHPGWGAEVELDLFAGLSRDSVFGPDASFRYGAFVSIGLDHFEGDREGDDLGNTVDADDLDTATLLVGGKLVTSVGDGQRVDGRIGLGAVHYAEVDATFAGPGVAPFEAELLEETWTLAFELRGHWGIELGPFSVVLGLGFRTLLPPHDGDGADLSAGPLFTLDLDVGAELTF